MRRSVILLATIMLTLVQLLGFASPAFASFDNPTIYEKLDWPMYKVGGGPVAGGGSNCNVNLTGDEIIAQVYTFFVNNGYQPYQAAGIVGNMKHESNLEPQRLQGTKAGTKTPAESLSDAQLEDNGLGWGIVQWTPPGKFINNAPSKPQANNLEVQLVFLLNQLEGKEPHSEKQAGDELKATKDIENATVAFQGTPPNGGTVTYKGKSYGPYIGYERPHDKQGSIADRIDYAKSVLAEFGTGSGGSGSSGTPCSGGGIGTSPDGFVFPLQTTQAEIKAGVDGVRWGCIDSPQNCHHDYNAADINAETGTPVLAVRDGKITSAKDVNQFPSPIGSRVVLLANNNRAYYFAHMGAGTIKVHEGQEVKAGQVIGAVGVNANAQSTVRHLHIDELPYPPYDYRPDCGVSNPCSPFPFINIQPELIAAFKALP